MTTTDVEVNAEVECDIVFGKTIRKGDVVYDGNADAFRTVASIERGYVGDDRGYLTFHFTDGGSMCSHCGASVEIPLGKA